MIVVDESGVLAKLARIGRLGERTSDREDVELAICHARMALSAVLRAETGDHALIVSQALEVLR